MIRYAYPQEILIKLFISVLLTFGTTKFDQMKDTTETVCQRNSSKAVQQNFKILCSYEGHNV